METRLPKQDTSWSQWIKQHGPALVLLARQWCPAGGDAEDAVHDAFLGFWPKRNRVKDPTAYLYRCVRNAAIKRQRSASRRRRHERLAAQMPQAGWFTPSHEHEMDEDRQLIEQSLAALPEAQRQVVVMKIWGGLTFNQIAQSADISINTAASRYRYALEALRKAMGGIDQEPENE